MTRHSFPRRPELLTPEQVRAFQRPILDHYRRSGRDLPWRATADPYRILVSEIMLQQTQVDRVLPKYLQFIERFPDPASLAAAPLHDVLAAWSGLGYNRRARALQACAAAVVARHGGRLPQGRDDLLALPGIGPYTAGAVRVFAFNRPDTLLETNIRSVYIHAFFADRQAVPDADLAPLVVATLYRRNPRRWYNALMDYGAQLKKTGANPSRQSRGHVRQGPFRGSSRELRGMIIRLLLGAPSRTERALVQATDRAPEQVRDALTGLIAEGLVVKKGRRIAIAG